MKLYNCKKFKLLVMSVIFASWASTASALIPVTDPLTLAQGIINNFKLAIEAAFVKETMSIAGKMNSTIGQATSSFAEYVTDSKKKESAKSGPGSENGYFVFANELGDYCGITTKDTNELDKKDNMVNCMKRLMTLRASADMGDQRTARDIYVKSFHEMSYANVAEAVVQRNFAVNFEKEVLEPLGRKAKQAKTIRDDYSVVVTTGKEFAGIVNRLLMVQSAKLASDSFRDYGDFEIYPEDVLELN